MMAKHNFKWWFGRRQFLLALAMLCVLTVIPMTAVALIASPRTGENGAEIGNLMRIVLVGIICFAVDALVLRRVFSELTADKGLVLLWLTAVIGTILLFIVVNSSDPDTGPFSLGALVATFFLFFLPGLLVGVLAFAVIPRREQP